MFWLTLLPFLLLIARMQIASAQFGIVNNKTKDNELTSINAHGNRNEMLAMIQQATKDGIEKTREEVRKQFAAANSTKIAGAPFVRSGQPQLDLEATIDAWLTLGDESNNLEKKDLELICDVLEKISHDAIQWQSKLTPDEYKKKLFWFLQKLKKEGIFKVGREHAEMLLGTILENENFTHALLEEEETEELKEEIEALKDNPSKFREEIEAWFSEIKEITEFMFGGDAIDKALDEIIAEVAGTYPADLVATFRDFFLILGKIAIDLRLLDPQDPSFDLALALLIFRHVTMGS